MILGIQDENKIFAIKQIDSQNKVVKDELQMQAEKVGAFKWDVIVKSDSYYGVDVQQTVEYKVAPARKREIFIHEDDKNIDKDSGILS